MFNFKNKKMKKYLFIIVAFSCLFIGGWSVINNISDVNSITKNNIEALSIGDNPSQWYQATKYDIQQKYKIKKMSGAINGYWISMILQNFIDLDDFINTANNQGISYELELVNCHKRVCVDTTIQQQYACPGNQNSFVVCHDSCDHSENQL